MAYRCWSMSVGVMLPMAVDGGERGLENSRHHLFYGLNIRLPEPTPTPYQTPDEEGKSIESRINTDWKDIITSLVI